MRLRTDDTVVGAWATRHAGPGWANAVITVALYRDGALLTETIQPNEQSHDMGLLFPVAAEINGAMVRAVVGHCGGRRE